MSYQPPHEVRDDDKLNGMIQTLRNGGDLPDVIVQGEIAFCGSHRLAAYAALGIEPDVIEITDEQYCGAMAKLGLDPTEDTLYDYDQFCEALGREYSDYK